MAQRNRPRPAILAEDLRRAGIRRVHADKHFDGRRLAGAIVAEKGIDGALGNFEINAIDDGFVSVSLDQIYGWKSRRSCALLPAAAAGPAIRSRPFVRDQGMNFFSGQSARGCFPNRIQQPAANNRPPTSFAQGRGLQGHLHSKSAFGFQNAQSLEFLIGTGDGVRVDNELAGQVAHARDQFSGRRITGRHAEHHLGGNLFVDRH